MTTTTQPGAVQRTDSEEAKAKQAAYNAAFNRLKDQHRRELDGYIGEEFSKRGLIWNKRLTEGEKAERAMEDLLEAHPELAERLRERFAQMNGQPDA